MKPKFRKGQVVFHRLMENYAIITKTERWLFGAQVITIRGWDGAEHIAHPTNIRALTKRESGQRIARSDSPATSRGEDAS